MNSEGEIISVWLKDVPRRFRLPYPLESIGFIKGHPPASVSLRGKLELCLRLASPAEFARDAMDGVPYVSRYPHFCIKLPEVLHTFSVEQSRDAVYFKYAPELAGVMKEAGLLPEAGCREFEMRPEIANLLREVQGLMPHSQEFGVADRLDLLALRLIQALYLSGETAGEGTAGNAAIRRIASYFQLHFLEEIDFEEVAAANGLSLRNFFRLWGEAFPEAPAAYLRRLKLNEACRLLQETNAPVWEITARLRFRNSSYFSRLFRENCGVPPLQYRRAARLR